MCRIFETLLTIDHDVAAPENVENIVLGSGNIHVGFVSDKYVQHSIDMNYIRRKHINNRLLRIIA